MKVASVIPSLSTRCGGPIINLVESIPHLRGEGVEVTIFTTDMGGPATARPWRATADHFPAGAAECEVRSFRTESPRRFAHSPALKRALRADLPAFDLVRIHGLYLHPQCAAAAEAQRGAIPYIVTPHGALDPWIRRRGRVRKRVTGMAWHDRMLRMAAAVHATTQAEADLFGASVPPGLPLRVVGNGVAADQFADLPLPGAFRKALAVSPDVPLLLFLGRLSRKKGLDILIKAVAQMQRPDIALVIVGPDDEGLGPFLRGLATEVGIADQIHFVGPLFGEARLQALADADVWLLPSHTENFGNAVIEAMAAGVPTIISTAVNISPDVQKARAGRVVPCDPAAFAVACAELLDDPRARTALAAAGRRFASAYDWSAISRQLAAMFREFAR